MKTTLILTTILLFFASCTENKPYTNLLIPVPGKTTVSNEFATFSNSVQIKFSGDFHKARKELIQRELENAGIRISEKADHQISFIIKDSAPDEKYRLDIAEDGITIEAGNQSGIYYGLQTFKQLLALQWQDDQLPVIHIEDSPNYSWRGMHLDVSRHFISKEYLVSFIDLMASYKLNKLHLHLTDDQGWRLEIKKYPKLTEEGAWRKLDNKLDKRCFHLAKELNDPDYLLPENHLKIINGDTLYGGFYTQADMREIISFAAQRNVEIIPEIDMPGHILSAAESYPELTCFNNPGWGNFSSPLCAGDEKVYEFIENVLTEVSSLFPSDYIHIGADEVEKTNWEKCPKCQNRIKENNLANEHELQGYFVKRIHRILQKQGKTMICWDEVLDGGMPKNTVMMHWRNWNTGAAEKCTALGNKYVVSLCHQWYLAQKLNIVYNLDPVDPNISEDKKHLLLGVQTCSWGEEKASENLVSRANIPAMQAIAEIGWSKPGLRQWDDFIFRLEQHLQTNPTAKFKFSKKFKQEFWAHTNPNGDGTVSLTLHSGTSGVKMEIENKNMEKMSYRSPMVISENNEVKINMILPDTVISKPLNFRFNKATGKKIQAEILPPHSYGNVSLLIDGLTGGDNYNRERWIAYLGNYFRGTIDLGSIMNISEIKIGLLDNNIKDDLPPATFSIQLSKDGQSFFTPQSLHSESKNREGLKKAMDMTHHFQATQAQYVKIINSKYVPGSNNQKKQTGFIFMDEIQVD